MYDITAIEDGSNHTLNSKPCPVPKHPFSTLIVAGKGSGKTTLLLNMISKDDFYRGKFEKIILMVPTFHSDKKWDWLMNQKGILSPRNVAPPKDEPLTAQVEVKKDDTMLKMADVHTDPDEYVKKLKAFRTQCKETFDEKGRDGLAKTLLVLDDCLGLKILRDNTLVNFLANSRHYNCSIIFSVQRYVAVPPTIRLNTSALILFPCYNKREIKQIYEENSPPFDEKTHEKIIMDLFNSTSSDKRSFLVYNNQNQPSHRLCENFQEYLLR